MHTLITSSSTAILMRGEVSLHAAFHTKITERCLQNERYASSYSLIALLMQADFSRKESPDINVMVASNR